MRPVALGGFRIVARTRIFEPWVAAGLTLFVFGGLVPTFLRAKGPLRAGVVLVGIWWVVVAALAVRQPRATGEPLGEESVLAFPVHVRIEGAVAPLFVPLVGASLPGLYGTRGAVIFAATVLLYAVSVVVVWRAQSQRWAIGARGIRELRAAEGAPRALAWSEVTAVSAPNGKELVFHGPGAPLTAHMVMDGIGDLARLACQHLPERAKRHDPAVMQVLQRLAAGRWTGR